MKKIKKTWKTLEINLVMPRNQLDKEELKCYVLKLKSSVDNDVAFPGEKDLVQKYLNKVLDKIEEYRY